MYHILRKGDVVLSFILFQGLIPQSADFSSTVHIYQFPASRCTWFLDLKELWCVYMFNKCYGSKLNEITSSFHNRHINSDLVKHHCIFEPWCTWNIVPPAGPLFIWATKRGGPRQKGVKSTIFQLGDSFLRVMDREAGARMSGRHQIGLIS